MKPSGKLLGVLAILIALVVFVFWRLRAVQSVVEAGQQATVVARHLTSDVDSVSTSAVDQRYRMRRDAVASMRTDLLGVATKVAAFITDSGYPRTYFNPGSPYQYTIARGNLLQSFAMRRDGLTATIASTLTSISCSIDVPFRIDTAAGPPRAVLRGEIGQPVCAQQK